VFERGRGGVCEWVGPHRLIPHRNRAFPAKIPVFPQLEFDMGKWEMRLDEILAVEHVKRIERVEMLLDYIDRLGGKWYPSRDSNSFKHVGGGAPLARELLTNYPEETFSCVMAAKAIFWAKHGFQKL
jgi:hypothetical protein